MNRITRIRTPQEIDAFVKEKHKETDEYYRSILKYWHSTYGAWVEWWKMEAYRDVLNFLCEYGQDN